MTYIVLHRMQKVGSQSLYHSLRAAAPQAAIEQVHFLTPEGIERVRRRASLPDVRPENALSLYSQIETAQRCGAEIQRRRRRGEPYCILSGVRDPLDQLLSQLFQYLPNWFPEVDVESQDIGGQVGLIEQKVQAMFRQLIVERQPPTTTEQQRFASVFVRGIEWFDQEFKPFHGFDVYEHEPDERGLIIIDRGSARHIVYRQESLRTDFHSVVRHVPGVNVERQIESNETSAKAVGVLYHELRRIFQPGDEMFDFYYGSRYFHHFYRNCVPRFPRWRVGVTIRSGGVWEFEAEAGTGAGGAQYQSAS